MSYLYSMETFPGAATRVLQEFRTLLQHGPHMLGSTHMLQIITINMFAIHNANSKGNIVHNLMIMMVMIMIIIIFKCQVVCGSNTGGLFAVLSEMAGKNSFHEAFNMDFICCKI